jgi:DNA repair exonuclease SbcCD ATPase subunit
MIRIKNITIKNFMSVGNTTQAVNFAHDGLTLVLGNNLDLGGEGSRNGTGKTTLINALSYAVYGQALTNIRKDNLVNKTNNKNMLVTVDFEKDGHSYRIERGRKPNKFQFIVDDSIVNEQGTDEAQGENRLTQDEVLRVFDMSHTMFKHIVALNTYTEPFLAMKANDQRSIIEELLGISRLSEKAERLKELMRDTNEDIKTEQARLEQVKISNEKMEETIRKFQIKNIAWEESHKKAIVELTNGITELEKIDIDAEIQQHKLLTHWQEQSQKIKSYEQNLNFNKSNLSSVQSFLESLSTQLSTLEGKQCPMCEQELHTDKHTHLVDDIKKQQAEKIEEQSQIASTIESIEKQISEQGEVGDKPETAYSSIDEAYDHRQNLAELKSQLESEKQKENPHTEQIAELKAKNIEEVDYAQINTLQKLKDHQDFLYKLLTSKDSFIRKKIIDQNLLYLNSRLNYYLDKIGLPHEVVFKSDLTVEITELGRELDFDNLSRGERNRLILGLSWAFRDVYESMNTSLNLLFIDELVDSGMDTMGVESAMSVLKKMSREGGKNIFLISHRDELTSRCSNVLNVVKENGFTSFATDIETIDHKTHKELFAKDHEHDTVSA